MDSDNIVSMLEEHAGVIGTAVMAAAQFIPQYEDWALVIPPLFRGFPESCFELLPDVFELFRFDPSLVLCAIDTFTVETLMEKFTTLRSNQQHVALKFFLALIQSGQEFAVTDELMKYLNRLSLNAKYRRAVDPIKRHLMRVTNPRRTVMEFLEKLQGEAEFDRELEKIRNLQNLRDFETDLETQLLALLTMGSEAKKNRVISTVALLTDLRFEKLTSALLKIVTQEESIHHEAAVGCLAARLNNHDILVDFLKTANIDEATEQAMLSVLLKFLSDSTPERVSAELPAMFSYVSRSLECDVIPRRRIAVLVLVECKVKLGKEFTKYMKRISTPHQKLIELYITKRRK
jgi:hypothetical protein